MDPIADMLTIIRNAQAVQKETAVFTFSKVRHEIVRVLKQAGLIQNYEKKGRVAGGKKLELRLKYSDIYPAISKVRRVSKPGRRVYFGYKDMFPRKGVLTVVSTPKGIMSLAEAKKAKLGGEVLCEIS